MYGERLREQRNRKRLTLDQVGELLGLQKNTLSGYERERHEPKFDTLIDLAALYGVSVDYLLGITNDPDPRTDQRDLELILKKKQLHYGGVYLTSNDIAPVREMMKVIAANAKHRGRPRVEQSEPYALV